MKMHAVDICILRAGTLGAKLCCPTACLYMQVVHGLTLQRLESLEGLAAQGAAASTADPSAAAETGAGQPGGVLVVASSLKKLQVSTHTVLYCTVRYCTVLYCTVLYPMVPHCTSARLGLVHRIETVGSSCWGRLCIDGRFWSSCGDVFVQSSAAAFNLHVDAACAVVWCLQEDIQAASRRLSVLEGSMAAQMPECLTLTRRLAARQADAESRSSTVTSKVSACALWLYISGCCCSVRLTWIVVRGSKGHCSAGQAQSQY